MQSQSIVREVSILGDRIADFCETALRRREATADQAILALVNVAPDILDERSCDERSRQLSLALIPILIMIDRSSPIYGVRWT